MKIGPNFNKFVPKNFAKWHPNKSSKIAKYFFNFLPRLRNLAKSDHTGGDCDDDGVTKTTKV